MSLLTKSGEIHAKQMALVCHENGGLRVKLIIFDRSVRTRTFSNSIHNSRCSSLALIEEIVQQCAHFISYFKVKLTSLEVPNAPDAPLAK